MPVARWSMIAERARRQLFESGPEILDGLERL